MKDKGVLQLCKQMRVAQGWRSKASQGNALARPKPRVWEAVLRLEERWRPEALLRRGGYGVAGAAEATAAPPAVALARQVAPEVRPRARRRHPSRGPP